MSDALGLLIDGVKVCAKKAATFIKWNNTLTKTVNSNMIFDGVFSEEDLDCLAEKIKRKNGFNIQDCISEFLYDILEGHQYENEQIGIIIDAFISQFLVNLQNDFPDLYTQHIVFDTNKKVTCLVDDISKDVKNVCYDVDLINKKLKRKSSKNYSIEFFKLDDPLVAREIDIAIQKRGEVFLKYYCPNECLLRVLNYLFYEKKFCNVVVAYNKTSWDYLKKCDLNDKILVAAFTFTSCEIISNNTNIFIFDDNSLVNNKKVINVRKRPKPLIDQSLISIGYSHKEANDLLKATNGLFIPLNALICDREVNLLSYDIDQNDLKILSYLLFITNFDFKDLGVISNELNIDEEDLERICIKYSSGNNPLLIHRTFYDENYYLFACYENAWEQMEKYLCKSSIIKLFEFTNKCLTNKIKSSQRLKKGLLIGVGHCLYKPNIEFDYIKDFVDNYLNFVNKNNCWDCFFSILNELTSISPRQVLDFLINSFVNKGKIYKCFSSDINVPNILWSIEQTLQFSTLTEKAINFLCLINECQFKYYSNNPKRLLEDLFCTWFNMIPDKLSKSKCKFAEKFISKYSTFWDILSNNIFYKHNTIFGSLSPAKYANETITNSVNGNQMYELNNCYLSLCIDNANNVAKISELLDEISYFNDNQVKAIFAKIDTVFSKDAYDLMKIKEKIRHLIHQHKFFDDAEWRMSSARMQQLEAYFNGIKLNVEEYEYHYLFINDWDDFILDPVPYKSSDYQNINEEKRETQRKQQLNDFKNKNLNLNTLLKICSEDSNCIGYYLASVFDEKEISIDTLKCVLSCNNFQILYRYCCFFAKKSFSDFTFILNEYKKEKNSTQENIANLIKSYKNLDEDIKKLIEKEDYEVKKIIFNSEFLFFIEDSTSKELIFWVLDNMLLTENYYAFVSHLEHYLDRFTDEEVYLNLIKLSDKNFHVNTMFDYYIEEIVKKIKLFVNSDFERIKNVALIELKLLNYTNSSELYFLNKFNAYDPSIFELCLLHRYSSDSFFGTISFCLLNKPNFCPGIIDGVFDEQIFINWIAHYKDFCSENHFEEYVYGELGRTFAYSPADSDGIIPLKQIRNFIEKENNNEINKSFYICELSKRGAYTPDSGVTEHRMATEYMRMSEMLDEQYPICALIYKDIANRYFHHSELERLNDE